MTKPRPLDTISHGAEPVSEPPQTNITMSGGVDANTVTVTCYLRYDDAHGAAVQTTISATISAGTWTSSSFQLPYDNHRYLFCALFVHSDGSSVMRDVFLQTGSPPGFKDGKLQIAHGGDKVTVNIYF
jgi:hypothetical protein